MNEAKKFIPGLRIVNLQSVNMDRELDDADILILQKSVLQRSSCRHRKMLDKVKFSFLIIDEAQTLVRGQPTKMSAQLLYLRNNLLHRAKAVYQLSGTPFMGKIKWDYIEMLKSLATSNKRSKWSTILDDKDKQAIDYEAGYDDERLAALEGRWDATPAVVKSKLLIPVMLRRTLQTVIDGKPVVDKDYFKDMVVDRSGEINVEEIQDEIKHRNLLLDRTIGKDPQSKCDRYVIARYLAWTTKVLTYDWRANGKKDKNWWSEFTIADAEEFERGRRLVRMLKSLKARGKKPIVFAYYSMHQQFAARVLQSFLRWLIVGPPVTWIREDRLYCGGGESYGRPKDQ